MKRFVSILLSFVLLAVGLGVFAMPSEAAVYHPGDVNGDGAINGKDSSRMRAYIAEVDRYIDYDASDLDGDGKITSRDSLTLRLHLAGVTSLDGESAPETTVDLVNIAGRDIGLYTIVVTDEANENMCFAAEELAKYVKIAAGRTLLTEYGESGAENKIILASDSAGVMGNDGFSLTVKNGCLTITGGALRGTMYGVYEFLEKYVGFRFFGYYEEYLFTAESTGISEGTSDVQIPVVTYRCNCIDPFHNEYVYSASIKNKLSGATSSPAMLRAKYGYGIERLVCNAHSLDYFVSKEELAEISLKNYCLSSAKFFDVCLNNMCRLVDERVAAGGVIGKDITELSCSYSAENTYCSCRLCTSVYNVEGSQSGILVRFVNKIDDALHEKYPLLRVITNAYSSVRIPPKVSVLNDDVVLLYCWNGCANHKIGSGECSARGNCLGYSNYKEESYYLGWAEHASQIYVWYYPTNIYYLLCPEPNLYNLYNDFRWFISHKAVGFYVVGTKSCSFEDMLAYLINQLMWDQDMTEDEYYTLMREYMQVHYGDGYESILEYTRMMTEAGDLMGCVLNDFEQPFDIYSADYFRANFSKMRELFQDAYDSATTQGQRDNIGELSVHMYFLGYSATYESDFVNGDSDKRTEYAAGWEKLYNYINDRKILTSYNTVGIEKPFTTDVSPMRLVYDIDGSR